MKKIRVLSLVVALMLLCVCAAQAVTISNVTYKDGVVSWKVSDFEMSYDAVIDGDKTNKHVSTAKSDASFRVTLEEGDHILVITDMRGDSAKVTFKVSNATPTPTVAPTVAPTPTPSVQELKVTKKATKTVNYRPGDTNKIQLTGVSIKSCKSSATKVATVTNAGVVTLKKAGTAKITVTKTNKKSFVVTLKVVDVTAPTKVKLNKSGTVKLKVGQTLQLNATITVPEKTEANQKLTWSSSSKKYATVDQTGLVTGVKAGTTTITVKTNNGKKATVKIKVSK